MPTARSSRTPRRSPPVCARHTNPPTAPHPATRCSWPAPTSGAPSASCARVAQTPRKTRAVAASSSRAPRLKTNGDRLKWTRVGHVRSYVLMRDVAGQESQYSLINATTTTPPPVPGATVTYAVRTAVDWSSWSGHRRITYPSPPSGSPAPPTSPPGNDRHAERTDADRLRPRAQVDRDRRRQHLRAGQQGQGPA